MKDILEKKSTKLVIKLHTKRLHLEKVKYASTKNKIQRYKRDNWVLKCSKQQKVHASNNLLTSGKTILNAKKLDFMIIKFFNRNILVTNHNIFFLYFYFVINFLNWHFYFEKFSYITSFPFLLNYILLVQLSTNSPHFY